MSTASHARRAPAIKDIKASPIFSCPVVEVAGWVVNEFAAANEKPQIEELEKGYWENLMPECVWQFPFRGLGPRTVGIDTQGGSLQIEAQQQARQHATASAPGRTGLSRPAWGR